MLEDSKQANSKFIITIRYSWAWNSIFFIRHLNIIIAVHNYREQTVIVVLLIDTSSGQHFSNKCGSIFCYVKYV